MSIWDNKRGGALAQTAEGNENIKPHVSIETCAAKSKHQGQLFGPECFSGASADNAGAGAEREGDGTW